MSDTTNNRLTKIFTLDNVLCLLLTVYITANIVFTIHSNLYCEYIFPIIAATTFTALKFIFKKSDHIHLTKGGGINKRELIIYTLIIIVACTISITWNYPASMSRDSLNQYNQAITNTYSDWHPLFHTFIFFKIPTIFWQSYTSCAIFQCMFITLALLYFYYFCRKYFLNKTQTIALLTFIIINPIFLKMATKPLKDVPFSYCLMLGTVFLIEIVITKGEWLEKLRNKVAFCLICFGIVFFRHNGIANFILIIIPLLFFYKKASFFLSVLSAALIISKIVIVPICFVLDIGKIGDPSEILGIPLNQISYIYNNGGNVSSKDIEIINKINKIENWEKYYNKYGFNKTKKECNGYNRSYVAHNYGEILKTWINMVYDNPILAIKSYINVTSVIWNIKKDFWLNKTIEVEYSGPQWVSTIMDKYVALLQNSRLKHLLLDIAEGLILIIVSLCLTIRKKRNDLCSYLPYILVLSNIVIIMCLITGGETRFVYSSILCSYPLILYAFYNDKTETTITSNVNNTINMI